MRGRMRLFLAVCTVCLWLGSLGSGAAFAGPDARLALVIGNNAYAHVAKLKTAVADARSFKSQLSQRGFEVIYAEDASRQKMNSAIEDFFAKVTPNTVVVVYYSGHGVQIGGANYLVPVDLNAMREADIFNDSIDLGRFLERLAAKRAKFGLVIVDACRSNPFSTGTRAISLSGGLAPPFVNAQGLMIIYSAGINQVALDRLGPADKDPNGVFAREFLKAMRAPGQTVQQIALSTRVAVWSSAQAIGYEQMLAVYDQSMGDFIFSPEAPGAPEKSGRRHEQTQTVSDEDETYSDPPESSGPDPYFAPSKVKFIWPVRGRVVSEFGAHDNGERNYGINIAAPELEPIHAAADGSVSYVGNELRGYGNLMLIKHSGYVTAYAHADHFVAEKAQWVKRGQVIGYVGTTGDVRTPQIHFEIRRGPRGETPLNPRAILGPEQLP